MLLFLTGLGAVNVSAQVAIGDNKKPEDFSVLELIGTGSGLRLPQLTATQRNTLNLSGKDLAVGLMIQNTTSGCIEYWNGKKWVSLCKGQANITFLPSDPTQTPFPYPGESRGPIVPSDDPNCSSENPAYSFVVLVGEDYLTVTVLNEATGEFRVSMDENPAATGRTAILRITNNCSQEYQEFVFTQVGDGTGCGTTATVPVITSENGTSLCGTGAAYLYLTGRPASGTFIWTLNGKEVGRGTAYTATTAGQYIVYGDKIGCTNSQNITVSASGGTAPAPVSVIAASNNGFVCSSSSETTLFTVGSGNIVWYKDGVKQSAKTGSSISAGIGVWFAVVENGGCSSLPSNSVTVSLDPNAGQTGIDPVSFKINGTVPAGNNISLCAGGSLLLEVVSPQTDVTYKWYSGDENNGVLLGSGTTLSTTVAAVQNYPILQCVASKAGACTQSQYATFSISATNPPAKPVISSPSGQYLCGTSATLTASSTGATAYEWYKDGVKLTETTATLIATAEGIYTAYGVNAGGCVSAVSNEFKIEGVSGYGTVIIREDGTTLSGTTVDVNESSSKTLTAAINPGGGANYVWTLSGNVSAPVTTGASITVTFGAATSGATAQISVAATNACTPGGVTATVNFNVQANCAAANVTAYSPASKAAEIVGSNNVTLSVTPNGDPSNFTYQWWNSSAIGGATGQSYSASAAGTYYCVVTPKCGGTPKTSDNFTVTAVSIPVVKGSGSLAGKTCFDINKSNFNTACGLQASRTAQATNFATLGAVNYTFTKSASGTVNNVRYVIEDDENLVTSTKSGTVTMSGNTGVIAVTYKTTLNNTDGGIFGRDRDAAAKVKIYVIYNDGAQDVQISLTVKIQDCVCCGAATQDGSWLTFMCHNLGADESIDPFAYNTSTNGDLYQWGRRTDGHEKRTSATATSGWVTLDTYEANPSSYNKFYTYANTTYYDWIANGSGTWAVTGDNSKSRWGSVVSGTVQNSVSGDTKGRNDPCPAGWRVPSQAQWGSIFRGGTTSGAPGTATANTWTWDGNGYKVGSALYLPAAGYRNYSDGSINNVGSYGYYWSSTWYSNTYSYYLYFNSSNVNPGLNNNRANGRSVRCVSE